MKPEFLAIVGIYARAFLAVAGEIGSMSVMAIYQESTAEALFFLIRRPICELSYLGLELAQPQETLTAYTLRMTLYSC